MGKSGLITQSNYIPWKGYFDAINRVDELVLLDDVQFTRRDWRNRNRMKTADGLRWLTVPVQSKGRFTQLVSETRVTDDLWGRRHLNSLRHSYARAPHFAIYERLLDRLYLNQTSDLLSDINRTFIDAICDELGITTVVRQSSEFDLQPGRNERLIGICGQTGITDYFTGPAARAYLDTELFAQAGIRVHWLDYCGYPEYDQLHGPFEHHVTIWDLLFHTGSDARHYMLTFGSTQATRKLMWAASSEEGSDAPAVPQR